LATLRQIPIQFQIGAIIIVCLMISFISIILNLNRQMEMDEQLTRNGMAMALGM
jgi:hypothetical protein